MSQRTGGFRRPALTAPVKTVRTAASGVAPRSGLNPRSCMNRKATTSVTPSIAARRMYGTPRFVTWATIPPRTDPVSIAAPPIVWARPKTDSSVPVKPVAARASTSQASVAPEKNVNPRPRRIEATAQPSSGAWICHIAR